jgi:signal transduction histidine kinase
MRQRAETVVPAVVLIGFVVAAIVVSLLLSAAQRRGLEALEEAVAGEVNAIAASQDQRLENSFRGASGIIQGRGEEPLTFEVGSERDLELLEPIIELVEGVPTFRAGFYLVDVQERITQGFRVPAELIGTDLDWEGLDIGALQAGLPFQLLPVEDARTVNAKATATVIALRVDPENPRSDLAGLFVLEEVIDPQSSFNQEIGALRRGSTGEYLFLDSTGTALAANDPTQVAEPVDDEGILELEAGLHRRDGRIVAVAEVPTAGWRVVFRQDIDEFEGALSEPLQAIGTLLVIALLGGGAVATVLLARRLRATRLEQERLQQLSESQQEFVSIVSHELRTPVAGVLGFLETSLDHWDAMEDEERRNAVRRAASNARRLQSLTRDVLDTQSIEEGRLTYAFVPLDLSAEVKAAVEAARDLDPERPFELTVPEEPTWVDGDADRLHQVLTNLIDNARKSSPAMDPIEIELSAEGDGVVLAVSDHGPGISEDLRERIFDKFVRGRGDSVSGTGLGLYIVARVVEAHRGKVSVADREGAGACFEVRLPRRPAPSPGGADAVETVTA